MLGVLAHSRRHWLVEERQLEILDVDEFKLGVATPLRDFVSPFGHGLALAAGPRASDNDGNSKHQFLLFTSSSPISNLGTVPSEHRLSAVQPSTQLDFTENRTQERNPSDRILRSARILGVQRATFLWVIRGQTYKSPKFALKTLEEFR